jgi:hypothetical protein
MRRPDPAGRVVWPLSALKIGRDEFKFSGPKATHANDGHKRWFRCIRKSIRRFR